MSGKLDSQDKQELILNLLHKIFCVGQHAYSMSPLHADYVVLIRHICQEVKDRHLLIIQLQSLFTGRQNISQVVYSNLIKAVSAIYDSYMPPESPSLGPDVHEGGDMELSDLVALRTVTQHYFMQVPQKQSQASMAPIMMAPCLEQTLKNHRIWTFAQVWLHLSKSLDVNTTLGIQFLQDQMASYEVEPDLFEKVSLLLKKEIKSRKSESSKAEEVVDEAESQTTSAMSEEAENSIQSRVDHYRQIYHQKMSERALQTRQEEENRRKQQ